MIRVFKCGTRAVAKIRALRRVFSLLLFVCYAPDVLAVSSQPRAINTTFANLRAVESRMDRLGSGIALNNVALCRSLQPDTGMVLHTLDSYAADIRDIARDFFGFETNLAVLSVRSGSAAARAGVLADDSIVAFNDVPVVSSTSATASVSGLIASNRYIASLSPTQPIKIGIRRNGLVRTIIVNPEPSCRVRFELVVSPDFIASSDGEMVQVSSAFFAVLDDSELAVLIAHELAHNVLEHPQRLAKQGVVGGLLAGFGRNVRFFRQTETEADILSVSLVANAGYSADDVATFWASAGRRIFSGAFTSRSHPSWRDRAATAANEAKNLSKLFARPITPTILLSRDAPLDGNWQAILVDAGK